MSRKHGARMAVRVAPAVLLLLAALCLFDCSTENAAVPQTDFYLREGLSPQVAALIDDYREFIPLQMNEIGISGCAIALVYS